MSAALTESEDDPSLMKNPLLSTNRPLYVNLSSGQSKHTPLKASQTQQRSDFRSVVPDDGEEVKDYQEQLKQMLQDLAKEKEKDAEKPLPLMSQVTRCTLGSQGFHRV